MCSGVLPCAATSCSNGFFGVVENKALCFFFFLVLEFFLVILRFLWSTFAIRLVSFFLRSSRTMSTSLMVCSSVLILVRRSCRRPRWCRLCGKEMGSVVVMGRIGVGG